jgi:hypothetical protein
MRIPLLCALALPILAVPMAARQGAEISGFIRDATQAFIAGVDVTIFNEQTGSLYRTQTENTGLYEAPYLHPGIYKIRVSKQGFRTLVRFDIRLEAAQAARLDFEMQIGDMREVVTVTDSPPLLNTQDGSVGTRHGKDWIEHLPESGRGFANLLGLAPGTVLTPATTGEAGQFSVNGQRANTNYFSVDGVSANVALSGAGLPAQVPGGSLPTMTAFGSLHSLVPLEALHEFHLQTSTASPEHGRAPGGLVALTSRSGSNEFHGALSGALRDEALDANDWFSNRNGNARPALRMLDVAAAAGGPVRNDRTFFFASYEQLRLRQPYAFRSTVPSLDSRDAPLDFVAGLLQAFPEPNGTDLGNGVAEWIGSSMGPSSLNSGSLRVDHSVRDWLRLFGRYSDSASSTEFGTSQINSVNLRAWSLTLGLTTNHRGGLVNEFRGNRSVTSATSEWRGAMGNELLHCYTNVAMFGPHAPCESYSRISIGGVGQLVAGTTGANRQGQWQIVNTTTIIHRLHHFRMGVDYRQLASAPHGRETSVTLASPSMAMALRGDFTSTIVSAPSLINTLDTLSLFFQDTWRATPRLTLTGGVRWEFDPPPKVPVPPTTFQFPFMDNDAETMAAWRIQYTSFAPRFGLAYLLNSDGRTVFRSGFGRFFVPDFGVAVDGMNGGPYNVWQFQQGIPYQSHPPSAPPTLAVPGYARDLRVPAVWQWNAAIEHALSRNDVVSAGYVGSGSSSLLRREVAPANAAVLQIVDATNHGISRYHSLQLQYRRQLSLGLQTLASYTWAHSIDNGSVDSAQYWYGASATSPVGRGSSDFDIRHSATIALSYNLPRRRGLGTIWGDWSLNGVVRARTGFPIDVLNSENMFGNSYADIPRPNRASGVPFWIADPHAPGGNRLNPAAFVATQHQGNLGRNVIVGRGMSQLDLALQRLFPVSDTSAIEIRAEVFNVLNHPNFADPVRFLDNPLFGQSLSMLNLRLGSGAPGSGSAPAFQTGGPRACQIVVRFKF